MSTATHCDGPDCDTWAKTEEMTRDFLTVTGWGDVQHFCCWNCLLLRAAQANPLTTQETL